MRRPLKITSIFILILFAFSSFDSAFASAHQAAATSAPPGTTALATIRQRFVQSLLPVDRAAVDYLNEQAAKDAASLAANGSWPDINYAAQERSDWTAADHLDRVLRMSKSARILRNDGRPDTALEAKINLALQWWTDHKYHNPNWWWNEIGIPQLLGQIGNLMLPEIPAAELDKMVTLMKNSDWRRVPWTGANLTWGVTIEIARGCMQNDLYAVGEGYSRMYEEIKIVSELEDGIQQDDSFHQHGAQLYNGGYGLDFAADVARFVSYSWGTQFQIPADKMAILSSYLLDGERWMIRGFGKGFDYSVIGREITRPAQAPSLGSKSAGPIYPSLGEVYGLAHAVTLLANEPSPHQEELQQFAAYLRGQPGAPAFKGNKQFWCSDYMVQRRDDYFTSVKMLSQRMLNAELVNSEGKKSVHLSDGANFIYLDGDEYRNIFPVWDWTKIPGTTAIQGTLNTGEPDPIKARGRATFVGGVSDGTYGLATMDLKRGNLTAEKSWFFFDSSYVALGTSITLESETEQDVATDVNQPLLKGDVLTSESHSPLGQGSYSYDSNHGIWIYHDRVGYIFPPRTKLSLNIGPQTGKWSDIGTGPDTPVTENVFDLWIDHGATPQDAQYQYIVVPNTTPEGVAQRAKESGLTILANNDVIQAVYNERLKLAELVYRKPQYIKTPLGTIRADHACLLLVRKTDSGLRLTASDPEDLPLTLTITVDEKPYTFDLPGGNLAGSSVNKDVQ
ncbi:MAG TPA: polysaccharide lyase family 8 super-sandwich domain-containing protein [Terracidiphilus sp.]|nr:polysaccharide lyase family 8 super-sandwich domain-containing protein [Terracidiphilus sp.]